MNNRNNLDFQSPSILHNLSDSTDDSYAEFKRHLSQEGEDLDDENDLQSRKRVNPLPPSSLTKTKSKKLFNPAPLDVARVRRSRLAFMADQFRPETNQEQPESSLKYSPSQSNSGNLGKQADDCLKCSPNYSGSKSLNNGSNQPDNSCGPLEYSSSRITTRSRHYNVSASTNKNVSLRNRSVQTSKYAEDSLRNNSKSISKKENKDPNLEVAQALSETAADLFLKQFDQELARESVSNKNFDGAAESDDSNGAAEDKEELASGCSNNVQGIKSTNTKNKSKNSSVLMLPPRSARRDSVESNAESVSSVSSNVSKYGRVRRNTSPFIQATIFSAKAGKDSSVRQRAASIINSNSCYNRNLSTISRSSSIKDHDKQKSDQTTIITSPHLKKHHSRFESPSSTIKSSSLMLKNLQQITPKSKGAHTKRMPSRTYIKPSRNGSDEIESEQSHEECEQVTRVNDISDLFKKPLSVTKHRNQKAVSRHQSEIIEVEDSLEDGNENVFKKSPCFVKPGTDEKEVLNSKKSIVVLQNLQLHPSQSQIEKALLHSTTKRDKYAQPPTMSNVERESLGYRNSYSNNSSHATFQAVDNNFEEFFESHGRRPDQNQLHTVVNDEVISLKWFAPQLNFDLELSNGTNTHCSLPDFKQYFSTSTAGYLKIDGGQEKSMQILKKCYMFYKVEKGEAVVHLTDRTRLAQVGSMFFIPQGAEYTIRNANSEEDLILLFVKMTPPT